MPPVSSTSARGPNGDGYYVVVEPALTSVSCIGKPWAVVVRVQGDVYEWAAYEWGVHDVMDATDVASMTQRFYVWIRLGGLDWMAEAPSAPNDASSEVQL